VRYFALLTASPWGVFSPAMKLALIAAVFPNRAAVVRHEEGVAKHRE
jgi:hypothetical protein